MTFKTLCLATAISAIAATAAQAAPFGPATAGLGSFDTPTVTINNGVGNDSIKLNGGNAQLQSGTGNFAGQTFAGSGSGTLLFSETPNTITSDVISGLFSFDDNQGGRFVFNLSSIDTVSFSNAKGVSSSIGLYLLGTMSENNTTNPAFNLSATATSLTMTFNQTGTSAYSESGSLANPPSPPVVPTVPEPASLALLGAGLASVGFFRRRARK